MKKINLLFALIIVGLIALGSCKKGDAGIQGLTGNSGPVGPAGKDGSVIYSGSTIPPATLGNAGDYYLQVTTGAFYGPKQSSGWGTSFSLSGATGATGASGSQVLSGTVDPIIDLGAVGDYYLDKTKLLLYGPKTLNSWGLGLALKGKDGNANVVSYVTPLFLLNSITNSSFEYIPALSYLVPAINYDVVSKGAVLGFLEYKSIYITYPLPYEVVSVTGVSTAPFKKIGTISLGRVEWGNTGKITINYSNPNKTPYTSNDEVKFRFVVIQGTTLQQLTKKNPTVDFTDYNQVSKLLKL